MGRKLRLCSKKYRDWPKKSLSSSANVSISAQEEGMDCDINDPVVFKTVTSDLKLPPSWNFQFTSSNTCMHLYKLFEGQSSSKQPLKISHAIILNSDFSWNVFVHNNKIERDCVMLQSIPANVVDANTLSKLVQLVSDSQVCAGNPDEAYVQFCKAKKGKFLSKEGEVIASIDSYLPVTLDGEIHSETIRKTDCEILINGKKCSSCKNYRKTIRLLHSRWSKKSSSTSDDSSSSHVNDWYLNTPEKLKKIDCLRRRTKKAESDVKKLLDKVNSLINEGREVDCEVHRDLVDVMNEHSAEVHKEFPEGSFARVFWDQQLSNAQKKSPRQFRWHPLIIKWCLNMRLMSGSSYHAMRTAGFVTLPSERTLRDYSNYITTIPGLQPEVIEQMKTEVNIDDLPESKRYVTILLDEIKIKEDLVFDKHSCTMTGFVRLGSINDQLLQIEQGIEKAHHPPIANHVLVIMVRGLFFKLEFPLAHFPSKGCTGEMLYPIVWDAIRAIEMTGLKVIAITADGASANRRFFRMHGSGQKGLVHKTKNIYADDDRFLYFISDPPHLVKTIRNCWSLSYGRGFTREMFVNGKSIQWQHLINLYEKIQGTSVASQGLTILPKLKLEHVKLTSFSRMRVDLAAQALSTSVANAFKYYGDPSTTETERFIRFVDKFFDCLNVRSLSEWATSRKPNRTPYTSSQDDRFKWLRDDFLKYLSDWENEAKAKCVGSDLKYHHFTLSTQTCEGIRITVNSFIELCQYLLPKHENSELFLLSERLTQDPLENYFGQQRARGHRNENPSVKQLLQNASALRVQKSSAINPVRGNCSKKRQLFGDEITVNDDFNTPLPKRKRHTLK